METIVAVLITPAAFAPSGDVLVCPVAPGRDYFDQGLVNGRPEVVGDKRSVHTPSTLQPQFC